MSEHTGISVDFNEICGFRPRNPQMSLKLGGFQWIHTWKSTDFQSLDPWISMISTKVAYMNEV